MIRPLALVCFALGCATPLLGQEPAPPNRPPVVDAPLAVRSANLVADLPVGRSDRTLRVDGVDLQVFFHRPPQWSGQRQLLVLHGVLRNADEYRDHAAALGERSDALVVAPKFDAERFPSRLYQRGGILREDGTAAPPAEWTYAKIPALAAAVRTLLGRPQLKHWILGHSAGGQFVMRMSAFQDTGAERLVAANPGSVLLPDRSQPFGYGFGGLPAELADEARLQAYLAAPLTLYLGTADDHPDENFDQSREAMVTGNGRHQRGLALFWTARTLATTRGWQFGWRLVEAPEVGHDHQRMFDHAACAEALFGPALPTAKPAASGR